MSVWDWVRGQPRAVSLLSGDVASGKAAHAYLFAGTAGRAPMSAATALAAALLCAEGGCGACDTCDRVKRHAHPDVEIIEPAGMQMLVEQVRDAARSVWRRPVAGRRRVVIVDEADRMNPNAQNAFLKALEEPPPSTVVVLVAPAADILLETVRSRCREVPFRAPTPAEVEQILVTSGVMPDEASRWARVGGELERAQQLAHDPDLQSDREDLVAKLCAPLSDPGEALDRAAWLAQRPLEARRRASDAHKAQVSEHGEWYRETKTATDTRGRRVERRAEQDAVEALLDDIAGVLRDVAALAVDASAPVVGEDVRGIVERKASAVGAPAALAVVDEVATVRRRLRQNANVLLSLEHVMLAWHRHLG